ncbi:branched-chain amino acid ABC transporter permease [Pusillimonas noertemannii]|uniref:Amino acid/amide ABC transporter membrane protein 2 (HAAT family) n=1 Tax=Pusillimonas noertemannii TaxID=305977 RepID=A0A2U1CNW0_9BURK|nr:branched-chain amino acid ABC transporter permease [Pusillimonas noertemannii]NYT68287.1 branched-chain amino acid ABC transporter permease [Pusillimonas noertemannii]PVY62698.1 amino acid/amide ABC transporter membrane protein 2 (HAAT family) [Pusillimonas noertemannii]TFL10363.1 branched-chain amino acid ABC transporter permease [Pusillimonas noertemannii]
MELFLFKPSGGQASARRLPSWALLVIIGAGLALLPVLTHLIDAPFYITLFSRIMIFALIALSLGFILGFAGLVCFGQAAFAGVGAYVVLIMSDHAANGVPLVEWPFAIGSSSSAFITWPAAMLASGLVALVIGLIALRTRGVYFIMLTLAFAQMIYFFFVNLDAYGGEDGASLAERSSTAGLLDLDDKIVFYYVTFAILALAYIILRKFVDSRFGMVLRGGRQNERRMAALGYSCFRYRLVAFVISGAIAGLAGALMVNHGKFISPSFMHWVRSSDIIAMVVLGGTGNLMGPILGAAAILGLEDVLSGYTEHWHLIYGPLLLLCVLFARRGLYGILTGKGADND